MASTTTTNRTMSDTHKAALAEGRAQGRAVRHYLEALESSKPKRGRKRTRESVAKRLEAVEALLETADPVKRLQRSQERRDLEAGLAADEETGDLAGIEAEVLAAAKPYSGRKGISYAAWREIGVPASTLRTAGITRSSR